MSKLQESEQAKLAHEYAQTAETAAVDWTTVPELIEFRQEIPSDVNPELKRKLSFDELVAEYKEIDDKIKELQARKDTRKEAMQTAVMLGGKDKVLCQGMRLGMISKQGSKKIMPEKLIALGVAPETIAKATVVGAGSVYLDVREVKDKNAKYDRY